VVFHTLVGTIVGCVVGRGRPSAGRVAHDIVQLRLGGEIDRL
jgi:hypothetical protein